MLRVANTITTMGAVTPSVIAQVETVTAKSVYPSGLTVKDYVDNTKNTATKIVWGSESSCDSTYWVTASTGCNGAAIPWGLNTIVNYAAAGANPEVKGSLRAWHFLSDKGVDKQKAWSIEANDVLNVLFYEFIDRSAGGAAAGAAYSNLDKIKWDVKQVTIKGATSTVVGCAALVAGALA